MFYSFLKVAIPSVICLQLASSFQLAVALGGRWAANMKQSFWLDLTCSWISWWSKLCLQIKPEMYVLHFLRLCLAVPIFRS
jgi:hypothetical protein